MPEGPVQHDITRQVWGDGDAVLLIFAGAAAEFALNRAVDWLFFTGALPRDPVGRLFRTVHYAQDIAFGTAAGAGRTLDRIRQVHTSLERKRGQTIPAWAHRAVLYMLIDYSERAARLLSHSLDNDRQEALYADFRRIGEGLGIHDLPVGYAEWTADRALRLKEDLAHTRLTVELYAAYRRQLGPWRYELLRRLQALLVPRLVGELLRLPSPVAGSGLITMLRGIRSVGLAAAVRRLVIPPQHWNDLRSLEAPGVLC